MAIPAELLNGKPAEIGVCPLPHTHGDARNYKGTLQEYAQAAGVSLPEYETLERPSVRNCYSSKVVVDGVSYRSKGKHHTRRGAEQEAAKVAIKKLELRPQDNPLVNSLMRNGKHSQFNLPPRVVEELSARISGFLAKEDSLTALKKAKEEFDRANTNRKLKRVVQVALEELESKFQLVTELIHKQNKPS